MTTTLCKAKRFFKVLPLLIAVCAAGCKMWDPDPEPKPFTISGTLTLPNDGYAKGATVQLKQNGENKGGAVTADDGGAYSLPAPIGENYSLEMAYQGYTCQVQIGSIPPRGWKPGDSGGITKDRRLLDPNSMDMYIAGDSGNKAAYWKNSDLRYIGGGPSSSSAKAIFVDGENVYVAGMERISGTGSDYQAVYWKNGVKVPLSGGGGGEHRGLRHNGS